MAEVTGSILFINLPDEETVRHLDCEDKVLLLKVLRIRSQAVKGKVTSAGTIIIKRITWKEKFKTL